MKKIISSLIIGSLFFSDIALANPKICLSKGDAARVVVNLEKCQITDEILTKLQEQNTLLKKQIELQKQEIIKLKEINNYQKNETELYKAAYEKEKKKAQMSIFKKGLIFGSGLGLGIILGLVHIP